MTRRVLILGNSHLACLREAWAAEPSRWPRLEATFLGAHKDLLLRTAVEGGRLRPATDAARAAFLRVNGTEEADLGACDAIIIVGCMIATATAALARRDMRWPGLPSLDALGDLAAMEATLVSRPAARAAVAAALGARLGAALARHLGPHVAAPIWLACQPRISAAAHERPLPTTRGTLAAIAEGDGEALSWLHEDAARDAAQASGAGYIPQPEATVQDHLLTARPYMDGAHRLGPRPGLPQPRDDLMHANARYGALMLDAIAAEVAQAA